MTTLPPPSSDALVLGIDVGTSRTKATVLDASAAPVQTVTRTTPWAITATGAQMAPADFLDTVTLLLRDLGEPTLRRVVAVGIASLGESGAVLDAAGSPRPVPILAWHDARGQEVADLLVRELGDDVVRRTGRPPRPVTTVAKVGWLAASGVDVSGRWVGVAGLIAHLLTGEVAQERSLAATSGAWDLLHGWDAEILELAGLSTLEQPRVVSAIEAVGRVTADGAARTGLPEGIPVHVSGHDHLVGAVAAGAGPSTVVDSMGSGEPILLVTPVGAPLPDARRLPADTIVTHWPGGDAYALSWEGLLPGMALGALADRLGLERDELERLSLDFPDAPPAERAWLQAWEEHGTADLPDAPAGRIFASALEGYAAAAAAGERSLRAAYPATDGPTLVIGGGQRSARWMRAKHRRATHRLESVDVGEGVARGAALLAGTGLGLWDVRQMTVG